MVNQPFYSGGLGFSCTRCSACCRYDSGYVFLSEKDVSALAGRLKIGYDEFADRYCRWVGAGAEERLSLSEKSNYDCIFWEKQCLVYEHRPLQCRTFPFWQSIVSSPEAWAFAAKSCPGIGKGCFHDREKIEDCLSRRAAEKIITRKISGGEVQ